MVPLCGPEGQRGRRDLGRAHILPGLGPPWQTGRGGFAMCRCEVAPLQAREILALLDQL